MKPMQSALTDRNDAAMQAKKYCVFCATGSEQLTALLLSNLTGGEAFSPMLTCHIYTGGAWEDREYFLLPGYVFLFLRDELPVSRILKIPTVVNILHYDVEDYELKGCDAEFAAWFYVNHGLIGKSKAIREGERIRILEGPLAYVSDRITKVNKQRRRARVEIPIYDRTYYVWLAFDWADEANK